MSSLSAPWLKRRVNRIVDLRGIQPPPPGSRPKTVFLHVGPHKTGTTTLQELLRVNAHTLFQRGILPLARVLPLVGDMQSSSDNEEDVLRHLRVAVRTKDAERRKDAQRSLKATLCPYTSVVDAIVASDEAYLGNRAGFSKGFYPLAARFVSVLAEAFSGFDAKVILYVRHQDRLLESNYLHSVKMGDTRSFEQFLASVKLNGMSWTHLCERVATVVGRENLVVRPFEGISSGVMPFAEDFFSTFTESRGLSFPEVAANPSLSMLGVQASRMLAPRMSPGSWRVVRQVIQKGLSNRLLPSPKFFSKKERAEMRSRFADDYLEALRLYGATGASSTSD